MTLGHVVTLASSDSAENRLTATVAGTATLIALIPGSDAFWALEYAEILAVLDPRCIDRSEAGTEPEWWERTTTLSADPQFGD